MRRGREKDLEKYVNVRIAQLKQDMEKAHNDYGAHYFLMRLFGLVEGWSNDALLRIHKILSDAIVDKRPQFRKSPPAALLSFAKLFPGQYDCFLDNCLSL